MADMEDSQTDGNEPVRSCPKHKRIVDKDLLALYRRHPCLLCKTTQGVVAHHIKTKGSGGPDVLWNLIPLCPRHHDEVHRKGLKDFTNRYGPAKAWLLFWGWSFDVVADQWFPPEEPKNGK